MKTSHPPTVFDKDPEKGDIVNIGGAEFRVVNIVKRPHALKSDTHQHILCLRRTDTDKYCQTFYNMTAHEASPYVYSFAGI